MKKRLYSYWAKDSSLLSIMSGLGIIIIASSRLAFALIAAASLLWVYCVTAILVFFLHTFLPKKGSGVILIFLSSFVSGLFFAFFQFFSPLLALEIECIIALSPCCCIGSKVLERLNFSDALDTFLSSLFEAATVAVVIIAISLIREPLGFLCLSIPGGPSGIIELFAARDLESVFHIRFFSGSAGALLLFGYGFATIRNNRSKPHLDILEEL
ncbi:MAG: hypothetical protein LBB43_00575 [Spirochaetaceae bacterium]|jgi:hypothetical protein|nr:hypothetical protein [Spirochaetaceae bacterium]